MSKFSDITMMYRIAKYYYEDNLSQNEIAVRENISRSQISRFLKRAKEAGIVKISICLPEAMDLLDLGRELERKTGLKRVVLSRASADSEKDSFAGLVTVGADYLAEELKQYKLVGLGWGKTLYHLALQLPYNTADHLKFIPLIGNSGTNQSYFQTSTIVDRFSEKFRAESYYNNLLVIRDNTAALTRLEQQRLEKLQFYWRHADAAVIGLGGRNDKHSPYIDEMLKNPEFKSGLNDICGDILAQFYRDDGTMYDLPEEYSLIAMELEQLALLNNVICVASGEEKVDGIICAARRGYISTLITDSVTGKRILEKIS